MVQRDTRSGHQHAFYSYEARFGHYHESRQRNQRYRHQQRPRQQVRTDHTRLPVAFPQQIRFRRCERFFPDGVRMDLELAEERRFRNGVVVLRYAADRCSGLNVAKSSVGHDEGRFEC